MQKIKHEPSSDSPSSSPAPEEPRDTKRQRKSAWTPEEDAILIRAKNAGTGYRDITKLLPGHDYKACQNRWFRTLQGKSGE
ncbi:hypothetical protein BC936DRAFT_144418, partial [Jimgerdemannia flammicorona]